MEHPTPKPEPAYIKAEDSDGDGDGDDISSISDIPTQDAFGSDDSTQSHHSDSIEWSEEDEHFANLFRPWDEIPLPPDATEHAFVSVLNRFETLIPPFERAIQYSDKGFIEYRERHKRAMEKGITEMPTWPPLYNASPPRWNDTEWNKRYAYLVQQRTRLIESRLGLLNPYMTQAPVSKLRAMFGRLPAESDNAVTRAQVASKNPRVHRRPLSRY